MNKYILGSIVFCVLGYFAFTSGPSVLGLKIGGGIKKIKTRQQCENELIVHIQTTDNATIQADVCGFLDRGTTCSRPSKKEVNAWVDYKVEKCMAEHE